MQKLLLVSAVTVFLMLSACWDDSNPSGPPSGDTTWMPLKVGNSWDYLFIYTPGPDTTSVKLTVLQTGVSMAFANDLAMVLRELGGFADTLYVESTSECLNFWTLSPDSIWEYSRMLDLPLTVGKTWQVLSDGTRTGECLSLSETVSVQAGVFNNCAKIKHTDDETEILLYAPGVGLVKNWVENSDFMLELSVYTIN